MPLVALNLGGKDWQVDSSIASRLKAANDDFRKRTGKDLQLNETYRTPERQAELYSKFKTGTGGRAAAPGQSFHQQGKAVDVGNWEEAASDLNRYGLRNDLKDDKNHFSFGETVQPKFTNAADKIEQARQQGKSDTEIASSIAQKVPQLAQAIQAARQKYGSDPKLNNDRDLVNFLALKYSGVELKTPSVAEKPVEPKWSDLPGNILPSTVNLVKGLFDIVRHPIKTVTAIGNIGSGLMEYALPGKQFGDEHKEYVDAVGKFFVDRYGGLDKIKKTIIEDPAGFALDVSTIFEGGGALLKGAGLSKDAAALGRLGLTPEAAAFVPKMKPSALTTAGETIQKVGKVIDPLAVPGRVLKGAGVVAEKVAPGILGTTTGAGAKNVETAFQSASKPEFVDAMRGSTGAEEVVANVQKAFQKLKQNKSDSYRGQLEAIEKTQQKALDISSIIEAYKKNLDRFKITRDAEGNLDFSRSTVLADTSAQNTIKQIDESLRSWGSRKGDRLPTNIDTLKRAFNDMYSPSSSVRAFTADMYDKTRKLLVDEVPGYEKMVGDYETASNLERELKSSLSLSGRAGTETMFRKLTQTMKKDDAFRQSLLDELQAVSPVDLKAQIAGTAFSKAFPDGLRSIFLTGTAILDPMKLLHAIPAAMLTSPRLVGEFLHALGVAKNQTMKFIAAAKETRAGQAAGKIPAAVKGVYQVKKTQR